MKVIAEIMETHARCGMNENKHVSCLEPMLIIVPNKFMIIHILKNLAKILDDSSFNYNIPCFV